MRTLCFDTETRGLRPELGETAFAVATAWLGDSRVRVHLLPDDAPAFIDELNAADAFLGHNLPFDCRQVIRTLGLPLDFFAGRPLLDTLVRAHHALPGLRWKPKPKGHRSAYSLKALTAKAPGMPGDEKALKQYLKDRCKQLYGKRANWPKAELHDYSLVPPSILTPYLVGDVARTLYLHRGLETLIAAMPAGPRAQLALDEELLHTVLHMTLRGLPMELEQLAKQGGALRALFADIEAKLPFPIKGKGSRGHLMERFGAHAERLKCYSKTVDKRTGCFKLTIDKGALQKMAADGVPYAQEVLDARFYSKRVDTYLKQWEQWIPARRLHYSINVAGPHTGRTSSSGPNMQNTPKSSQGADLRSVIVPEPGHVLLEADYKGMEYWAFAHLSGDRELQKALREGDMHAETATRLFGRKITKAQDEERKCGKTFNFAMLFGATDWKLMRQLSEATKRAWSRNEIAVQRRLFQQRYPVGLSWASMVVQSAEKGLTREDPLGRRYAPDSRRPYALVSFIVQGFAAGIAKRALLAVHRAGLDVRLPVHDSVLCMVRDEPAEIRRATALLREKMETVAGFHFPVEVAVCPMSWNEKRDPEEYIKERWHATAE